MYVNEMTGMFLLICCWTDHYVENKDLVPTSNYPTV